MIRPFRTAIWALGSGSVLIAAAALSRDESLRDQFLTEREPSAIQSRWETPAEVTDIEPPPDFEHPAALIGQAPVSAVDDASGDKPVAPSNSSQTTPKLAAVFQNASLRSAPREHGPTIQFGPLISGNDGPRSDHAGKEPLLAAAPAVVVGKVEESSQAGRSRDAVAAPNANAATLVARLYRPSTLTVSDLERLIRPLLTPGVGTAAASTTDVAGEESAEGNFEGGRGLQPNVLLVRDRPEVMRQIDALCLELDAAPKRVVIDALIADVTLPDSVPPGLELQQSRFGLIDAEPRDVVKRLRALGHVAVIATNQLHVVDRQWAELEWTQRLCESSAGGQPTVAAQESSLRLATKFRIRPSVLSNGLIRLEVHPESSRLRQAARSERPEMATVAFTTDLVLHAGATAVIAGSVDQLPADSEPVRSPDEIVTRSGDVPAIHPQPGVRRETVLLVMPRLAPEN
jgi:hypothetical protein